MKTNVLSVFFILLCASLYAQDFEYEIAVKTCDCLSKYKGDIDENIFIECNGDAFVEVYSTASEEEQEICNTIPGMQSVHIKTREISSVMCFENGEDNYRSLEAKYYNDSEDKLASSYLLTTQKMMEEGEFKLAIEGLLIAVNADSTFVEAYDNLGVCYRNIEDYENAVLNYKKSLKIFPIGKIALSNLGMVYAFMEDYENSDKCYNRLVEVHPNYAEGYFGLGKNFITRGDFENSLEMFCIAYRIYSNEDSEYLDDAVKIISILYSAMEEQGKQKTFKKILKKHKIKIKLE
jgi:tetratricopeptide (TPR) repeat protein